ncbi:MAG: tyrosine-type recombinase/integrase, partial [Verrucomicrobiota bacterium]
KHCPDHSHSRSRQNMGFALNPSCAEPENSHPACPHDTTMLATSSVTPACATHMLENGADIRYIQQLTGHAKLETTSIYTELSVQKFLEIHARNHSSGKWYGNTCYHVNINH